MGGHRGFAGGWDGRSVSSQDLRPRRPPNPPQGLRRVTLKRLGVTWRCSPVSSFPPPPLARVLALSTPRVALESSWPFSLFVSANDLQQLTIRAEQDRQSLQKARRDATTSVLIIMPICHKSGNSNANLILNRWLCINRHLHVILGHTRKPSVEGTAGFWARVWKEEGMVVAWNPATCWDKTPPSVMSRLLCNG